MFTFPTTLLSGSGITVPTDGPNSVYIPYTSDHFAELGIPAPTELYRCNEASGDLSPSIGSGDLVATGGTDHLYQQSVTDWSIPFVGLPGGSNDSWQKAASLAQDESCFVLAYISFVVSGAQKRHLEIFGGSDFIGGNNSTNGYDVVRASVNASAADGSIQVGGIDVVEANLWGRNSTDNESGVWTNKEKVLVSHSDSSASGPFSIGASDTATPTNAIRVAHLCKWIGADADALISAGLANEVLLTILGWPLGAGYP